MHDGWTIPNSWSGLWAHDRRVTGSCTYKHAFTVKNREGSSRSAPWHQPTEMQLFGGDVDEDVGRAIARQGANLIRPREGLAEVIAADEQSRGLPPIRITLRITPFSIRDETSTMVWRTIEQIR